MREAREHALHRVIAQCEQIAANVPRRSPSEGENNRSATTDGPKRTGSNDGDRLSGLEQLAAEFIVRERKRRVSMLAELEPGNMRLTWSKFEDSSTNVLTRISTEEKQALRHAAANLLTKESYLTGLPDTVIGEDDKEINLGELREGLEVLAHSDDMPEPAMQSLPSGSSSWNQVEQESDDTVRTSSQPMNPSVKEIVTDATRSNSQPSTPCEEKSTRSSKLSDGVPTRKKRPITYV